MNNAFFTTTIQNSYNNYNGIWSKAEEKRKSLVNKRNKAKQHKTTENKHTFLLGK